MQTNQLWGMVGVLSAVVIWGGLASILLWPRIKNQVSVLTCRAKQTPFRTILGLIAVGITVVYGGTKPPVTILPAFSYFENSDTDGSLTLLTVTNKPTCSSLEIPAEYAGRKVTALAADFCSGSDASWFLTVSIPESVTSVGQHFFGYGTENKHEVTPSVDRGNQTFAVTGDNVLYERQTGRVVYAPGDVTTVRFSIRYAAGRATGGSGYTAYKNYAETYTIEKALFQRSGYTQVGWSKRAEGTVVDYGFGGTYSDNGDLVLYPAWEEESPSPHGMTVTFDPMGGKGSLGPCWFPAEVYTNLPSCTLTKAGYAFAGWAERPYGCLWYLDRHGIRPPEKDTELTLYAIWIANGCFGIAFEPGEGISAGQMEYQSVRPGTVVNLNLCTLKHPSGKRFAGWACSNGRRYDDGMLVFNLAQPGEIVTMTAIWK